MKNKLKFILVGLALVSLFNSGLAFGDHTNTSVATRGSDTKSNTSLLEKFFIQHYAPISRQLMTSPASDATFTLSDAVGVLNEALLQLQAYSK